MRQMAWSRAVAVTPSGGARKADGVVQASTAFDAAGCGTQPTLTRPGPSTALPASASAA